MAYQQRYPAEQGGTATRVRPKVGLYFGEDELTRARALIRSERWAQGILDEIIVRAGLFAEKSEGWTQTVLPGKGASFAQGIMGCPKCRARWEWFGRSTCDWSRPLVLRCPRCRTDFPIDDPRNRYYDPGYGVVVDSERYFLRAIWNTFVVETFHHLADDLALAYALTGASEHAARAAVIMDHLAAVAPTTAPGPLEFQPRGGRFHFVDAIVNRRTVRWCHMYDLLYHAPAFRQPSQVLPGRTIAENVAENLLLSYLWDHCAPRDGEWPNLHNHTADTARAMTAVGIVLGIPSYVGLAAQIFPWFIENTIDPDGRYCETAASYANYAREIYADVAEMLARYRPERDEGPMLRPEEDAYRLNYFDHPKLQALLDCPDDAVDVAGHLPRYGDSPPDLEPLPPPAWEYPIAHWRAVRKRFIHVPPCGSEDYHVFDRRYLWSRMLALYASSPEVKERARQVVREMQVERDLWDMLHDWEGAGGQPGTGRSREGQHLPPRQRLSIPVRNWEPERSTLLGHQGIGILRSGAGRHARGLMMRCGPTLAHGHDDVLAIHLYGLGRDLTLDIGYDEYGTPLHVGWGMRQVAHNAVVVNRDERTRRDPQLFRCTGGEVRFFQPGGPFQAMEMDATAAHAPEGVAAYTRQVLLIDIDDRRWYAVDIFRIRGGTCHDYSFHATCPPNEDGSRENLTVSGVELGQGPAWTVAGLDPKWAGAPFDRPGCSWGERVWPAGFLAPRPEVDDAGGYRRRRLPAANPEPGNGYGWLFDVRTGTTGRPWQAAWSLGGEDRAALRLWMIERCESRVIAATGPSLYGEPYLRFIISRHEAEGGLPLSSRYAAVIEPHTADERCLEACDEVTRSAGEEDLALRIRLAGGLTDTILSGPGAGAAVAGVGPDGSPIRQYGRLSMLRTRGGEPIRLKLIGVSLFTWGDLRVAVDGGAAGRVRAVDTDGATIEVEGGSAQAGDLVLIRGGEAAYSHASPYWVREVEETGEGVRLSLLAVGLAIGRGRVAGLDGNVLRTPYALPVGWEMHNRQSTGVLDGKQIVGEASGACARIQGLQDQKRLVLDRPAAFTVGEKFRILDVAAGDRVEVVPWVELAWQGGEMVVTANAAVTLEAGEQRWRWPAKSFASGPARIPGQDPAGGA